MTVLLHTDSQYVYVCFYCLMFLCSVCSRVCVCECEGVYCLTVYVYLSVCLLWATMPEIK